MTFKQYEQINKNVSSEMFYSLMAILHEKLPCAKGFFRLKKEFRDQQEDISSPIRTIASPNVIRGLSISKKNARENEEIKSNGGHQEIRIKNVRQKKNSMIHSGLNDGSPLEYNGTK